MEIKEAFMHIEAELESATKEFGPFNSTHEAYGVMKEEFDEFWDAIKKNDINGARVEAIQIAAMATRFLIDMK